MRVALVCLLLFLGLPSAALAQALPANQQQLASLIASPNYRTFLQTAVNNVEAPLLKARCAQLRVIEADRFAIVVPATITPTGITGGMWISTVTVDRCGMPATRRILVQVGAPNALSPTAMLPGDFRGDIRLESDISRAMTAQMMAANECKDITRFVITDIKSQGALTPNAWSETWIAESCGKTVTAVVDYARSPNGAVAYNARDIKAL